MPASSKSPSAPAPAFIATDSRANKRGAPSDEDAEEINDPTRKRHAPAPAPHAEDEENAVNQPPALPNFTRLNTAILNGLITLADGTKITATPPSGFPTPQLAESVWTNTSDENNLNWKRKDDPKCWVRVYRGKYEKDAIETVEQIRDLVAKFLEKNEEDAAKVTPSLPTAMFETGERLPPPYHFLLFGISQAEVMILVEQKVIASNGIALFFLPFIEPLPTYICTLENFTYPDSEWRNGQIARLVQSTLRQNNDVTSFVHSHIPSADAGAAVLAINTIRITSLRINISATKTRTIWNVYCTSPPPFTLDDYFAWCSKIRRLKFHSEDFGTGEARLVENQPMALPFPKDLGMAQPACAKGGEQYPHREGYRDPEAKHEKRQPAAKARESKDRERLREKRSRSGRAVPRGSSYGKSSFTFTIFSNDLPANIVPRLQARVSLVRLGKLVEPLESRYSETASAQAPSNPEGAEPLPLTLLPMKEGRGSEADQSHRRTPTPSQMRVQRTQTGLLNRHIVVLSR
ncbi:hypothetical protein BJ138DRAFT_1107709 [Hygrophoropsis aurantiaca]|uniref:Uncharacterized protein n=1 Tax=Hygrophoropsis aurantiaca TaxID=72124 RepID=A0ACB7ZQA8_9AGAM|nr:hypothetical protein BJ138DRAFT_1107709 [Hygrophoropsis aurantiaca]